MWTVYSTVCLNYINWWVIVLSKTHTPHPYGTLFRNEWTHPGCLQVGQTASGHTHCRTWLSPPKYYGHSLNTSSSHFTAFSARKKQSLMKCAYMPHHCRRFLSLSILSVEISWHCFQLYWAAKQAHGARQLLSFGLWTVLQNKLTYKHFINWL